MIEKYHFRCYYGNTYVGKSMDFNSAEDSSWAEEYRKIMKMVNAVDYDNNAKALFQILKFRTYINELDYKAAFVFENSRKMEQLKCTNMPEIMLSCINE